MSYFSIEKFREKGLDHLKTILTHDDENSAFIMNSLVKILDKLKDILLPPEPDD
jgi:hypothetical protein